MKKRKADHPPPLLTPAIVSALSSGLAGGIAGLADRLSTIVKGFRIGTPAAEIAAAANLPLSAVEKLAEAYWKSAESADRLSAFSGVHLSAAERRQRRSNMAAQVAAGDSPATVAARFRVSVPTVRAACREFNVAPPKPASGAGGPTSDKTLLAIAEFAKGATTAEVAMKFGFSRGRASNVRRRAVETGLLRAVRRSKSKQEQDGENQP